MRFVRHPKALEWGLGRVLREDNDHWIVYFESPSAGLKKLRKDIAKLTPIPDAEVPKSSVLRRSNPAALVVPDQGHRPAIAVVHGRLPRDPKTWAPHRKTQPPPPRLPQPPLVLEARGARIDRPALCQVCACIRDPLQVWRTNRGQLRICLFCERKATTRSFTHEDVMRHTVRNRLRGT